MNPLLRQMFFLDTETTGLHRGASIHELALLDYDRRHVSSWIVDPNAVTTSTTGAQDPLRLTARAGDVHTRLPVNTWDQVFRHQLKLGPDSPVMRSLAQVSPWLHENIVRGLYPHLRGDIETWQQLDLRRRAMAAAGFTFSQQRGSVHAALGDIPRHLSPGSTLWIANAAFESKQVGAQLAADGQALRNQIAASLETAGEGSDILYVTGPEVNQARTLAAHTGDYRPVYEAYRRHVPAAGTTAVRDILDVTRALKSWGTATRMRSQKGLGPLGIDINAQMLSRAFGDRLALEVHRAAEDVALHEQYVLRRQAELIEAFRADTPDLRAQARRGVGPLAAASRYFGYEAAVSKEAQERAAAQRLARAREQLLLEGHAVSQSGIAGIRRQAKTRPDGQRVFEPRPFYRHRYHQQLSEVVDHIRDQYDVDWQALERQYGSYATVEQLRAGHHRHVRDLDARILGKLDAAPSVRTGIAGPNLRRVAGDLRTGGALLAAGVAAVGVAAVFPSTGPPAQSSVLSYGYSDWLARNEGMRHDGPIGAQRRQNTDFGSPYQGPQTSMGVLADQELLAERERWLRTQYGVVHGPGGIASVFGSKRGANYISNTRTRAPGEFPGLRGQGLQVLDVDPTKYEIELEDPDTLKLTRRGGALAAFMGQQSGYSFRLEGIDAPEVQHGVFDGGGAGYHTPQPGADQAAAAARALIAGKRLQLVINPGESTYGRQLAVLYADGKNYNLQAVQRGHAAFLPFGKAGDSMVSWQAFRSAETRAYKANRGMWSQPWARAFYEATSARGDRITFNTFTRKDRIVANSGHLSILTTMEAAQQQGWNPGVAAAAQAAGATAGIHEDKVTPWVISQPNAPHKNYLVEQQRDLSSYISQHGRPRGPHRLRATNGVRTLDSVMAVDTMGTSTSPHTRRGYSAYRHYGSQQAIQRRRQQGLAQRQQNHMMFRSPVGHHSMEA